MKKTFGLICLMVVAIINLIGLGKIVAYEWPDIERMVVNPSLDYLDERLDEAVEFVNEKMVLVFNKD